MKNTNKNTHYYCYCCWLLCRWCASSSCCASANSRVLTVVHECRIKTAQKHQRQPSSEDSDKTTLLGRYVCVQRGANNTHTRHAILRLRIHFHLLTFTCSVEYKYFIMHTLRPCKHQHRQSHAFVFANERAGACSMSFLFRALTSAELHSYFFFFFSFFLFNFFGSLGRSDNIFSFFFGFSFSFFFFKKKEICQFSVWTEVTLLHSGQLNGEWLARVCVPCTAQCTVHAAHHTYLHLFIS